MENYERINIVNMEHLRNNKYVREHDCGNGISSFNYTSKAFWDKHWDEDTVQARGLFVRLSDGEVVTRGYHKFWNIGERYSVKWYCDNFKFPLTAYVKENGYLLLVSSLDGHNLFVCSKSTNDNWYAENGRKMVEHACHEPIEDLADDLYQNNVTAVFEVITHDDEHIVRYHENHVVLLDIIKNQWEFEKYPYEQMVKNYANYYGFQHKKKVTMIKNAEEFVDFLIDANGQVGIEGYVIEDQNQNMTKVKNGYYRFKKIIRGIIGQLHSGKTPDEIKNYHEKIHNGYIEEYLPNLVRQYEYENGGECPSLDDIWTEIAPMI